MSGRTEPRPAYQCYVGDTIADALRLTLEEYGALRLLEALAWRDGGIPSDPKRLAVVLKMKPSKARAVWQAIGSGWILGGDGRFTLPWMETYRAEQQAFSEKQRENGKKGGRPRRDGLSSGDPLGSHLQPSGNPPVSFGIPQREPSRVARDSSAPASASAPSTASAFSTAAAAEGGDFEAVATWEERFPRVATALADGEDPALLARLTDYIDAGETERALSILDDVLSATDAETRRTPADVRRAVGEFLLKRATPVANTLLGFLRNVHAPSSSRTRTGRWRSNDIAAAGAAAMAKFGEDDDSWL